MTTGLIIWYTTNLKIIFELMLRICSRVPTLYVEDPFRIEVYTMVRMQSLAARKNCCCCEKKEPGKSS